MANIEVVIIDRDRLFLEALLGNQGRLNGVRIVGHALELEAGLEVARLASPDVVVIDDVAMRSFVPILPDSADIFGKTTFCVFADRLSDALLNTAIKFGVRGLLSKRTSLRELVEGLTYVAAGNRFASGAMLHRLYDAGFGRPWSVVQHDEMKMLTPRQAAVLWHLADGKRVKEIAAFLNISDKAVESHKYRLMNRLGIHDRVALCRWAIREGLIEA